MAETRRFAGLAGRSALKAANNLGVISVPSQSTGFASRKFRNPRLDDLDSYFEARQYAGMPEWDQGMGVDGSYIEVRKRAPRLQYNFAKVLCSRISSKLVGTRNFPQFRVEEDDDTSDLIRLIIQGSRLKSKMVRPIQRMLAAGSVLVRFHLVEGQYRIEHYLSKWVFPEFDPLGNITFAKIQYVFEDMEDIDPKSGKGKKKWFRLDLGQEADIAYDNPEFDPRSNDEPVFKVTERVDHGLGFVQAEWFRTEDEVNSIDGPSIYADVLGFIDELNYSLSQTSTAIQYNQDPQLVLKNMLEDEVEELIRSSLKAWNLGKEGEAAFLEAGMAGVEAAGDMREKVKMSIQDISRVVLLDPEKIVGSAQSAKAMEVLHGPMVELIEELQPGVENSLKNLILKMTLALLLFSKQGMQTFITIPPGFKPESLNLIATWPEIFPKTLEDLQKKVSLASSAASANLISRETMTKFLAKDFGVEDVELEAEKIAKQPVINPFGAF